MGDKLAKSSILHQSFSIGDPVYVSMKNPSLKKKKGEIIEGPIYRKGATRYKVRTRTNNVFLVKVGDLTKRAREVTKVGSTVPEEKHQAPMPYTDHDGHEVAAESETEVLKRMESLRLDDAIHQLGNRLSKSSYLFCLNYKCPSRKLRAFQFSGKSDGDLCPVCKKRKIKCKELNDDRWAKWAARKIVARMCNDKPLRMRDDNQPAWWDQQQKIGEKDKHQTEESLIHAPLPLGVKSRTLEGGMPKAKTNAMMEEEREKMKRETEQIAIGNEVTPEMQSYKYQEKHAGEWSNFRPLVTAM